MRIPGAALGLAVLLAPAFLILGPTQALFRPLGLRVAVAVVCGAAGGLLIPAESAPGRRRMLLGVLLSVAVVELARPLQWFTDYPFSLTWSEGNHFWASSLFFGGGRYHVAGDWLVPRYATSGMYGLAGLPLLIRGIGIEWVRLWNEGLLVLAPLTLAVVVFAGEQTRRRPVVWLTLAAWGFLFLMQAGVYAPLALAAAALWVARAPRSGWVFHALLLLSTFYLGISRWFWMAGPMIWGITFLLADAWATPSGARAGRLILRIGGVIGACAAGMAAAIVWSALVEHRPLFLYLASVRQPMLWYRWLPNATSPYGILPWAAVIGAPLVVALVWIGWKGIARRDAWRAAVILLFMAVFLTMGLVASVKIGGGDNLHNLDLLFVYLLLLAGIAAGQSSLREMRLPPGATLAAFLIMALPALQALQGAVGVSIPDRQAAQNGLRQIEAEVAQAAGRGPVLFIDQRQLFTFGPFTDLPLVMEHELIDLMDRAMAGDSEGLQPFYADLERQRYSLIVSDPLPIVWRGRSYAFGEENDAWVTHVTLPVLEQYEPALTLDDLGIWLLRPRPTESDGRAP